MIAAMIGRIVEIAEDGRHLSLNRGFMVVSAGGDECGRVPLDDIALVLVNAHGASYSNNLLVALAERGVACVICAANHRPVAWLWPIEGNHIQAARMRAQIGASLPLQKQLWKAIVRAKIRHQALVAESLGVSANGFQLLASNVRSGDPENIEAQAARRYWPLILGPEFRRDVEGGGANALLNYGYAVLRALAARAVCAAGLHPSLGIHHRSQFDTLALADDVMEPFRPFVDRAVVDLVLGGVTAVDRDAKKSLAGVAVIDLETNQGTTPLGTCVTRLASSLAASFIASEPALDLPLARPTPARAEADT